MMKKKVHAAINVLGLTSGVTFALTLGIFIYGELRVNQDFKDVERIYLLESHYTTEGDGYAFFAPAPLLETFSGKYPGKIESYYRFWDRQVTVSKGDHHFRVQTMIGDSTFQKTFGFQVLRGDAEHGLDKPNTIIVTQKIARQYFNTDNVIGNTLTLKTEVSGAKEFEITAVIADPQEKNSVSDFMNMDAQIFLPLANRRDFTLGDPEAWASDMITYVKLTNGTHKKDVEKLLTNEVLGQKEAGVNVKRSMALAPIREYYQLMNQGRVYKLILSLAGAALLILALAIANFINITLASSFSRLKEVGLRKVIGGRRGQVITQFLSESVSLAFVAGLTGIAGYELLRGYSSDLLGSSLPSVTSFAIELWLYVIAGLILTGVVAGVYPALYLSTTHPIDSLKGKLRSVNGTVRISRALIASQFLIAAFISVASLVMSKQVSFFLEKDLGYNKDYVVTVTSVPRLWSADGLNRMDAARSEFLTSSRIKSASLSWGAPTGNLSPMGAKIFRTDQTIDDAIQTDITWADESFADVYGLKLIEGRFLSSGLPTHQSSIVVLNESARKLFKVNVGDKIKMQLNSPVEFTVAGVVRDFHFESLHRSVKPVVIAHNRDFNSYRYFSFKLLPGSTTEGVAEIERRWKKIFPDDPFVYNFADDRLAEMYKTETQMKSASSAAMVLMIIIVMTGVLGLVSLSVTKRNKEIAIRKVLGASAGSLVMLLSKEYVLVMTVAFALGLPLSYLFVAQWLNGFVYRIAIEWWMFAAPVIALFVVTLVVIGSQSLKTIFSNPVKAIRCE
jgi:putative ABC transport system permease protein